MFRSWAGDFDGFCFVASWDSGSIIPCLPYTFTSPQRCHVLLHRRHQRIMKLVKVRAFFHDCSGSSSQYLRKLIVLTPVSVSVTNVCPTSQMHVLSRLLLTRFGNCPAIQCPRSWWHTTITLRALEHKNEEGVLYTEKHLRNTQICKCDCTWHHTARNWNLW